MSLGHALEHDLLRSFSVSIESDLVDSGGQNTCVGTMTGWYSRIATSGNLTDAGDAISGDAYSLAWRAQEVIEKSDDELYEEVLLIDRITLNEQWRGHKIMGHLVETVVDILQCDPPLTIAVVYPEPLALDGSGRLDDGPERDAGLAKLHAACRAGGFQPWDDGLVWWRSFTLN